MVRWAGRRPTALHRRPPPGTRKAAPMNRGRLFENRAAFGRVGITPRKGLGRHSTRASRRMTVLFFHAQTVALIESMNP